MYYLRHVTAAAIGPLVLAACMLLTVALYEPLNLTLVVAGILTAQLLFPVFLLVSTLLRNVKLLGRLPGSVLIACVALVLSTVLAMTLPAHPLPGHPVPHTKWMVQVAALAVGCWGSYILYMSMRPKQKLVLRP